MFHILNCGFWKKVSHDHRSFWTQFKRTEAWKSQDFNGIWTRDLAIPVWRSNQLSYEATKTAMIMAYLISKSAVQYMKHFIYHFTSILHGLIRTMNWSVFLSSVSDKIRTSWIDMQSSEIFSLLLLQPKILYVDMSDTNQNTIRMWKTHTNTKLV